MAVTDPVAATTEEVADRALVPALVLLVLWELGKLVARRRTESAHA